MGGTGGEHEVPSAGLPTESCQLFKRPSGQVPACVDLCDQAFDGGAQRPRATAVRLDKGNGRLGNGPAIERLCEFLLRSQQLLSHMLLNLNLWC